MHVYLFYQFWWLIFPLMFLVSGIVRMILRNDYRRRKLDLYKSYLDQGKQPPADLTRDL